VTSEEVSKEDLEETVAGYVREFELKTSQAAMIESKESTPQRAQR
jgi:hypothetical protein